MATKAELQDRLDALRQAMDMGVQTVDYEGRRITYRSFAAMRRTAQDLQARIDEIDGKTTKKVLRLNAKKGL